MNKFKVDLHTHSILSKDGGITKASYQKTLEKGILDSVAITDHNQIKFALNLNKKIGDKVIVGEEIMTQEGEVIGLFLSKRIKPGMSLNKTIKEIKKQKGLVLLPHPFDFRRNSLSERKILEIINNIDIFEIFNSRSVLRNSNGKAQRFAKRHALSASVGSDAHSLSELGKTYTIVNEMPDKKNLKRLLKKAEHKKTYVSIFNMLSPTLNRLRKKL